MQKQKANPVPQSKNLCQNLIASLLWAKAFRIPFTYFVRYFWVSLFLFWYDRGRSLQSVLTNTSLVWEKYQRKLKVSLLPRKFKKSAKICSGMLKPLPTLCPPCAGKNKSKFNTVLLMEYGCSVYFYPYQAHRPLLIIHGEKSTTNARCWTKRSDLRCLRHLGGSLNTAAGKGSEGR